ncbi:sialidase family protein [Micromonospora mirobrigensis]|uniref:BNR repeat-like domain-containing protein n=1 Tax=Micromonospora mirobrigensis TaxID=262898 RepID=A0A1C4V8X9_9ACTN|nr:sialidase family protein [Micromonospora mirobrigensis]SCE80372.1 BNR repeat-like domain-containing protein [Micromonospora mirobrigensis]
MNRGAIFTVAVLLAASGAVVSGGAPAEAVTRDEVAGLSPTAPALVVGPAGTVYDPVGDPPTWYAMTEAHDSGSVDAPNRLVHGGFLTNYDGGGYSPPGQMWSTDLAQTFTPTSPEGYETSARLDDGRVVRPVFTGQTSVSLNERTIRVQYSVDDGVTFFSEVNARLNIAPQTFFHPTANFFPNSVIQVPGGPLLMAGYAQIKDAGGNQVGTSLLMQSTDGGNSWTLRSTITQGTTAQTYSETAIVITSNGDLLAVSRSSSYDNLWARRSTDLGLTWTAAPQGIPEFAISGGVRPFGRINPRLALLPNGILVLVAGRPDNHVAVSYDGTGKVWSAKQVFYANHDTADPQNMNKGSSGNADFAWTEANRAALLADTCHAIRYNNVDSNKCTLFGGTMSGGTTQFQLKRAFADILTPDTGKIDLVSKAASGAVQLTGDLGAVPGHPRTGARGAVDGSNEAWSSAVRSGSGTGTLDLTLDRAYTLSKVGLSLAIGATEDATVQTRLNVTDPWSDWYTVTGQRSYALKYSAGLTPRTARYVRVVTGAASACPTGVTAPCSVLNEVELYANDVDSFENDPVNGIPRGYSIDRTVDGSTGYLGIWVSQATAGSGTRRVLRIADSSTVHLPAIRRVDSSGPTKTLEFRFHPDKWRPSGTGVPTSGFLFDVLASPVNGTRPAAYHLAAWFDGTIRAYVGGTWRILGTGPAFDPSTSCAPTCVWSTIKVQATTTQATVSVGGTVIGTTTRSDGTTSNLTGHQFAASSTAYQDETFLVDDVYTSNS